MAVAVNFNRSSAFFLLGGGGVRFLKGGEFQLLFSGEERCVTILKTAARETIYLHAVSVRDGSLLS